MSKDTDRQTLKGKQTEVHKDKTDKTDRQINKQKTRKREKNVMRQKKTEKGRG